MHRPDNAGAVDAPRRDEAELEFSDTVVGMDVVNAFVRYQERDGRVC